MSTKKNGLQKYPKMDFATLVDQKTARQRTMG